jgi:hypothetical protein
MIARLNLAVAINGETFQYTDAHAYTLLENIKLLETSLESAFYSSVSLPNTESFHCFQPLKP